MVIMKTLKKLFPKSGLLEEDKQRMLEFIEARDEAKAAYSAFVEHPGIRELLQRKTLSQIDKMWIQVLPIMSQYLKNIEHVISLWRARYQFETKLSIYVRNRSKLETLLESINNIGEMFLANKASVQESIKESLLAKLKEAMDLAVKTGKNINALVSWTILDVPQRIGVTWFRLGKEPRVPFHLHFSNEEAEELMKIAIKLEAAALVMMKLGMEVNISESQELIENLKVGD